MSNVVWLAARLFVGSASAACTLGDAEFTPSSTASDSDSNTPEIGVARPDVHVSGAQIVSVPTFNDPGGTYSTALDVTITSPTAGAAVYYTVDGNDPNRTSIRYTGQPVKVAQTTTLKALATLESYLDSAINAATYTIQQPVPIASAPTLAPPGGIYSSAVTVQMVTAKPNGKIFFATGHPVEHDERCNFLLHNRRRCTGMRPNETHFGDVRGHERAIRHRRGPAHLVCYNGTCFGLQGRLNHVFERKRKLQFSRCTSGGLDWCRRGGLGYEASGRRRNHRRNATRSENNRRNHTARSSGRLCGHMCSRERRRRFLITPNRHRSWHLTRAPSTHGAIGARRMAKISSTSVCPRPTRKCMSPSIPVTSTLVSTEQAAPRIKF